MRFNVTELPSPAPPLVSQMSRSAARGEQFTVAYWLNNDTSEDIVVSVDFDPIPGVGIADIFPEDGMQARVLMWRDRIMLRDQTQEAGDPCSAPEESSHVGTNSAVDDALDLNAWESE